MADRLKKKYEIELPDLCDYVQIGEKKHKENKDDEENAFIIKIFLISFPGGIPPNIS